MNEKYTKEQLDRALKTCQQMSFASDAAKEHFKDLIEVNSDGLNRRLANFISNWGRALEGEIMQGNKVNPKIASEICDLLDNDLLAEWSFILVRSELLLHWKYSEMIMTDKEKRELKNDPLFIEFHKAA